MARRAKVRELGKEEVQKIQLTGISMFIISIILQKKAKQVPMAQQLRLGIIQGTFRELSGNVQGTFRERSGNIQGTFRERSVNIPC